MRRPNGTARRSRATPAPAGTAGAGPAAPASARANRHISVLTASEAEVRQRAEREAEREHVRVASQLVDAEPADQRDGDEEVDRLRRDLGGDEGRDVAPDHRRTPLRSFFGGASVN